jgi:hypothetical protein
MKTKTLLLLLFVSGCIAAQTTYPEANYNVVVDGEATHVELYAEYSFAVPDGFTASSVNINRTIHNGYCTFYLPFSVVATDIASTNNSGQTYVYKEQDDEKVKFTQKNIIDANEPFLMTKVTATSPISFSNKTFAISPTESSTDDFAGNYEGVVSAEGKWGIGNDDKFVRGSSKATIKSFAAFLSNPPASSSSAKSIVLDDEISGINYINGNDNTNGNDNVIYDLQGRKIANGNLSNDKLRRGIYIINNKKVLK